MSRFRRRRLLVLETNLDDMNPEWFAPVSEKLFASGALDVTFIPIFMKKTRPGVVLQVLLRPRDQARILKIFFEETTTLGVRSYGVDRYELERRKKTVRTPWGAVWVKLGIDAEGRLLNVTPEFESCRRLAVRKRIPIKRIYAEALKVWRA